MSANLATLPTELLLLISRRLDTRDLACLTLLCARFRNLWANNVERNLFANVDDSLSACIAYYTHPDLAARHCGSNDRRSRFVRLRNHRLRLARFRRIIESPRQDRFPNFHINVYPGYWGIYEFDLRYPHSYLSREQVLAWIDKAAEGAREEVEKHIEKLGSAEDLLARK